MKKLLVICAALDLEYPYGATPAQWQLFKGLYEVGCEVIVIPYRGDAIRSLWWRCYKNPCRTRGELYALTSKILGLRRRSNKRKGRIVPRLARLLVKPSWEGYILDVLEKEGDVNAVIFVGVPMNQIKGIATSVRKKFKIPIIYYDLDVPTSLPRIGGYTFNYYIGADVSEFDAFLIASEGSLPELKEMGAQRVFILHFGVDPDVYSPLELEQDIDATFFGTGSNGRENSIRMMISEPSRVLTSRFLVIGRRFDVELGNASIIPPVPFSSLRNYCCRSKINLNIPREVHANTYATSTSRPFELASMGCCVVSAPYKGLDKWFDPGEEMFMVESVEEVIEIYQWLLQEDELRRKVGEAARKRVLKEHTTRQRARQLLNILKELRM